LQDGRYRLDLVQIFFLGHFLHALEFSFESELLVVIVEIQPAAKFQGGRHALKDGRDFLHGGDWRIVVFGARVTVASRVGENFDSGGGEVAPSRVDFALKVFRFGGEIEDSLAVRRREHEVGVIWIAGFSVRGQLARRVVAGMAVGGDRDHVVIGDGVGEVEREADAGGRFRSVGGLSQSAREKDRHREREREPPNRERRHTESHYCKATTPFR